ncbi:MAG: hypothetical protein ACE5J3_02640 [Methanosarcinales archaeon]
MYEKYTDILCDLNGLDLIEINYNSELDKTTKLASFDYNKKIIYVAPRFPNCLKYCFLIPKLRVQYFIKSVCHEFMHYSQLLRFGIEKLEKMFIEERDILEHDAAKYTKECSKWFLRRIK